MRPIYLALLSVALASGAWGQTARSPAGSVSQAVDNGGSSGRAASLSLIDAVGEAVVSAVSSLSGTVAGGYLGSLDGVAPVTSVVIGAPVFFAVNGSTVITSATPISLIAQGEGFGVNRTLAAVDAAPFSPYTGPMTLAAAGAHTLRYYSVDALGLAEPVKSLVLQVDSAPPATALTLSGGRSFSAFGQVYLTPDTLLVLTATDSFSAVKVSSYSIDGGPLHTYVSPFSLAEGTHTVAYFSQDQIGILEAPNSRTFGVSAFENNAISAGGAGTKKKDDNDFSGNVAVAGNVAADAAFDLTGNSTIQGNATAPAIDPDGRSKITGSQTILINALNPEPFDLGAALAAAAASNQNASIASFIDKNGVLSVSGGRTVTLTTGTYLLNGINLSGGAVVNVSGPATLFVQGPVNLSGSAQLNGQAGANAETAVLFSNSSSGVSVTGGASLGALVYAPNGTATMSGNSVFGGHLFAQYVNLSGGVFLQAGVVPAASQKPGALLAASAAFELGQVYAFPNPARRGANPTLHVEAGLADSLDLHIYDISGNLVKNATISDPPPAVDDGSGRGAQLAYEYTWDVSGVASGIYIYVATAHSGSSTIKATKKVAVIK